MKYWILLSLIFSILSAEYTLTEEQMEELHLKIEKCKLYSQQNDLLTKQKVDLELIITDQDSIINIQAVQIEKLEDINKTIIESEKLKWYESPYLIGILAFLFGSQVELK